MPEKPMTPTGESLPDITNEIDEKALMEAFGDDQEAKDAWEAMKKEGTGDAPLRALAEDTPDDGGEAPTEEPVSEPEQQASEPAEEPAPTSGDEPDDDLDEDDDDEPAASRTSPGRPELEAIAPEVRSYIEEMERREEQSRSAFSRRRKQLRKLREDRDRAVSIALEQRRELAGRTDTDVTDPDEKAETPTLPKGLEVKTLEDGTQVVDVSQIQQVVQAGVEQGVKPQTQAMEAQRQRGREVDRIVSGTPPEVQERLLKAYQALEKRYVDVVTELGVQPPKTVEAQLQLLDEEGITDAFEKEFGVNTEDLIDLAEGMSDPFRNGRHLRRVIKKYAREWGTNGKSAAHADTPKEPSKVRPVEPHPRSPARTGKAPDKPEKTLDEIINMSPDRAVNMSRDDKEQLFERWEKEMGLR